MKIETPSESLDLPFVRLPLLCRALILWSCSPLRYQQVSFNCNCSVVVESEHSYVDTTWCLVYWLVLKLKLCSVQLLYCLRQLTVNLFSFKENHNWYQIQCCVLILEHAVGSITSYLDLSVDLHTLSIYQSWILFFFFFSAIKLNRPLWGTNVILVSSPVSSLRGQYAFWRKLQLLTLESYFCADCKIFNKWLQSWLTLIYIINLPLSIQQVSSL